ncbi:uncharacterized protein VDAG_01239 [Verticillium dahliae VdLs.17]|uniref:Serine aminopeptidase S33 domain-containing protein n=1 Tax=Verticillium dahliae (strain VdLs.17 / ATCC MYA-4575 / FGSC 10137) TaxID=498257 RepID=G2WTW6_VERDV|nr:uncharacterized protein VDAG_01239 [Verticillium dahliae VdLs.17]EGY17557.1 hypothetical protein VDAG_01239 [Verticillium dahliae VdLs.17]
MMKDHLPSRLLAPVVAVTAVGLTTYLYLRPALIRDPSATKPPAPARSPRWTVLPSLSALQRDELPYPPDLLPGGRDVETPYGSLRVYEWGPDAGEKVLLLHGIGTPCIALGEMARALADAGHRVMLFDFFGRGYSDSPTDVPHDARLYNTKLHLALASSPLPWSGADAFHLVGYSLGGAIAASFARHVPHALRSLVLVAPAGLVRPRHVSRTSRLLYSTGLLPEPLLRWLVRRRLEPPAPVDPEAVLDDDVAGESDATGGATFDNALLDPARPELTVARVIRWQLAVHPGFGPAYRSTIRWAPIYGQDHGEWAPLRGILEERRAGREKNGLKGGRVCFVVGETDPVIVAGELEQDARLVLGEDAVDMRVVKGAGHEVGITGGREVAGIVMRYWQSIQAAQSCS